MPYGPIAHSLHCRLARLAACWLTGITSVLAAPPPTSPADELTLVTEFSPPYTYLQGNQTVGAATTPVRAVVEKAGYQPNFRMLSWKAAMDAVQHSHSILIYPVARTPEREQNFNWIGRIGRIRYYVYKLRGHPTGPVKSLGDLQHYRIAAIRGDVRGEFLLAHHFVVNPAQGMTEVTDNAEALQLLRIGRVDFAIFAPSSLAQHCTTLHLDCHDFERVMPLGLQTDLYLAAGPLVTGDEVKRLRAAYQTLQKDGTLHQITPAEFEMGD